MIHLLWMVKITFYKIYIFLFFYKFYSDQDLQSNKIPEFCQNSKKHRNFCSEMCNFTLIELQNGIGQKMLQNELEKHMHPKSRKINTDGKKRFAKTDELKNELIDHYNYFHRSNK